MSWKVNFEYKPLADTFKRHHDLATTHQTIKELLKDGTPDWYSHPEDYKNYAKEAYAYDKEMSDGMVEEYRMEDQTELIDFKARNINIISSKDFVIKLRENGIPCLALYNGMPGTAGLWAIVPTAHGADVRYVTFLQIPAMIEWSVLRLDAHNLPNGEDYRGWRTVVCELIKRGVITEQKAHEIFGPPTDSIVSRRYRKSLFNYRHRAENVALRDGF